VLRKTLIALAGAAALGCLPMATTALAAHSHGSSGHVAAARTSSAHVARYGGGHVARYGHGARYGGGYVGGPIYDSCAGNGNGYGYGYGYGPGYGCPGYGVPLVGGVINGILGGGYAPY
jgi:defect-in-organelle-trafficking protein DotC